MTKFSGKSVRSAKRILTEKQAKEIYQIYLAKFSFSSSFMKAKNGTSTQLASIYGVSPKTIRDIWNRRTWTSVTSLVVNMEDTSVELWALITSLNRSCMCWISRLSLTGRINESLTSEYFSATACQSRSSYGIAGQKAESQEAADRSKPIHVLSKAGRTQLRHRPRMFRRRGGVPRRHRLLLLSHYHHGAASAAGPLRAGRRAADRPGIRRRRAF